MFGKAPPAHGRGFLAARTPLGGRRGERPGSSSTVPWCACLLALVTLASPRVQGQPPRPAVHVFVHVDVKPSALEKALQQQLAGLSITVFSRYRDLEDAGAQKPDALVAIEPVLQQRGRKPSLQGTKGSKDAETYLLVSVGHLLESLSGKVIGVVDVLGRDGTQSFVANLLKTNDVKVKRVAKSEDLLSLLEFAAADGIVIPSSALARLSERTQLAIKSKEVPGGSVGLPALAIFNDGSKEAITKAFLGMDAATKRLLGIDAWSVR